MHQGTLWRWAPCVLLFVSTLQANLGGRFIQACALHHDGRPACCGQEGLLQHGTGHFVEMGTMCPADCIYTAGKLGLQIYSSMCTAS